MEFNPLKPQLMHVDMNSCFAMIEQQANPLIRGKEVVVVAYEYARGTVLSSSTEARRLGIKTGMRLKEARLICPKLISLEPDSNKYRDIHRKFFKLLKSVSPKVIPKSIDEFVIEVYEQDLNKVAIEIKRRIKEEIGDYITVSIGIGPNRYLSKIAAGVVKPDGLVEINKDNYLEIYSKLKLTDLTGIKRRNQARLNSVGIYTVLDLFNSPIWKLKIAFHGISGYYWYLRLRGYEIDDFKTIRKTYGNSYAPPLKMAHKRLAILSKLCEKTGFRLRKDGMGATGIHVSIQFREGGFWHKGEKTKQVIYESSEIYKEAVRLLKLCPTKKTVRIIAVNVFNLVKLNNLQLNFFEDVVKKSELIKSVDKINKKWGDFVIHQGRMANTNDLAKDRIGFGRL